MWGFVMHRLTLSTVKHMMQFHRFSSRGGCNAHKLRSTSVSKQKQRDAARVASASSSRRRLLKEAVYRLSGGSSRPDTARAPLVGAVPIVEGSSPPTRAVGPQSRSPARQPCLDPLLHLRPAKAPLLSRLWKALLTPSRRRAFLHASLRRVVLAPLAEPLRPKMFVVQLSLIWAGLLHRHLHSSNRRL
ncbi:hypothetical protein WMY93_009931 [Mugilogobius chulae]|uniref:Uncharacterized protein n=1 Tax=Mugilogobius chulae TaxID=88201 RepID=A0AAW0PF04_9GOBI